MNFETREETRRRCEQVSGRKLRPFKKRKISNCSGFFVLTRDTQFWKCVKNKRFHRTSIKMIVPKGAVIFVPSSKNGPRVRSEKRVDGKRKSFYTDAKKLRVSEAISMGNGFSPTHVDRIEYKVGKVVKPNNLFYAYSMECAGGIHVFSTKAAADEW